MQDFEEWVCKCMALGATKADLVEYDKAAFALAVTLPYSNDYIVRECRSAALFVLNRGLVMPATPNEALAARMVYSSGMVHIPKIEW